MGLLTGTAAPWIKARTHQVSSFALSSVGGYYILMVFLPPAGPERDRAQALLREHGSLFDDRNRIAFGVIRDEADFMAQADDQFGIRYFLDAEGEIARRFKLLDAEGRTVGQWVLLDPTLRVVASLPLSEHTKVFANLETWTDPGLHAGAPTPAPVLVIPRVFEPGLCRRLIRHYHEAGGEISGVMIEIDGITRPVVDDFKRRRDAMIHDLDLQAQLRRLIELRLLPEVRKAFQFTATAMERYLVARYGAEEGGYFRAHRDNTTKATAHRRFACSINLNAEDFEGGDLRFPEFGRQTYRPPTGGAVVFSCSLLHEATPVTRGERFAFLPFFYDAEGERIREENLRFLASNADGASESTP